VLNGIAKVLNDVDNIEIIRLGWACHILRLEDERISSGKRDSQREIPQQIYSRKMKKERRILSRGLHCCS